MTLKQAIEKHSGLRFIVEELNIYSSIGRKALLNISFSKDKALLSSKHSIIEGCQDYISEPINQKTLTKVRKILSYLNDIRGTLNLLVQNQTLDDVSLFEIKQFSIACYKIKSLLFDISNHISKANSNELTLPDLNKVISILDPEGLLLSQFYIYNAYSKELTEKRKEWEKAKKENIEEKAFKLYLETQDIEDKIREKLSLELKDYVEDLKTAIRIIGQIDIYFAMAEYFIKNNYTKPQFSKTNNISYKQLSYPPLSHRLGKENKHYQPINISLSTKPCLVTGANMAGKTILLKSLWLSQYLIQFGFFVPAQKASIVLVEDILTSIGDHQNEHEGLSSYASEILLLNQIIQKVKQGKQYLVLVDELARTTNPTEGLALVDSFLSIMAKHKSFSITTTHYSGIKTDSYRLRVKGFIPNKKDTKLTLKDIPNQIDYSLIEDKEQKVPNEALNLASLLGIDEEFIEKAREFLK
ncbi:MAG: DNA mismatch repair protein MutS [Bacteroidales bacterium]|jgi:DNA mismatch repair ATPase MutS|nr:DNA mismatch repair protein MutS [Bacteroidales bacterium]MDD4703799.1 DNA mismatch repair protein MutS [Bacteroidales bacterium]MDX9799616.1 DNA mismatch repair protein MutS [Bacteroidales bacterium]